MNDRNAVRERFLHSAGWGNAEFHPIAGDASFRHYARLEENGERAILMDAPPESEPVAPFLNVQQYLLNTGFRAPRLIASDVANGFLLLEDFGDDSFTRLLREGRAEEKELYLTAIDVLAEMTLHGTTQETQGIRDIPLYDWTVIRREAALLGEWLLPLLMSPERAAEENEIFLSLVEQAHNALAMTPRTFVHRDYHADNLFWLPEDKGIDRVGLLDFQDALFGSPAYDLVSLLEDARRDVSAPIVNLSLRHFITRTGLDEKTLRAEYAFLGMQRNAKILGIFARLWRRDGKPRYLDYLPRVFAHFVGDIEHPELSDIRQWAERIFTQDAVTRIHQPDALRAQAT